MLGYYRSGWYETEVDKCIKLVETKGIFKAAADEVNRAEDYFGWKILTPNDGHFFQFQTLDVNGGMFEVLNIFI